VAKPAGKHTLGTGKELAMGNFGWPEILLIVAVVLLLFGAKRLPEMARSLGRSSREFKKGMQEGSSEEEHEPAKSTSDKATTSEKKTE
jgi:sec-independent protein translocase protein TatA